MPKPKRIILIRHGQSESNADKNVHENTPDHRTDLTALGRQQAREAGAKLRELIGGQSIRAYVSPYNRTRQTFQGVREGDGTSGPLNIVGSYEDPRIREQDFGHLRAVAAHRLIDDERKQFGTFFYRIPDGESGADVYDRISTFLETLWRDFAKPDYPDNALLVTHGLTIRLFLMRWFHWSVEHFERLRNPSNCEFFVMRLDPARGRYELQTPMREFTPEETAHWLARDVGP